MQSLTALLRAAVKQAFYLPFYNFQLRDNSLNSYSLWFVRLIADIADIAIFCNKVLCSAVYFSKYLAYFALKLHKAAASFGFREMLFQSLHAFVFYI